MQQILKFFIRNRVGILFLVLFTISIGLTIQSHSYHNNKWVSSTNVVSSFFFDIKYNISSYFNLKADNKALHHQNKTLHEQLVNAVNANDFALKQDTLRQRDTLYQLVNCHIISNSYNKTDNYVLIDVGNADGVYEGYGVSLPNGIMGIVEKSANKYSRVISILNTNLSINAKIKGSYQFGSLKWDTNSYDVMVLEDLPRSANFKLGDTIVTGNNSLIFPKDIPIGVIKHFDLDNSDGYYYIEVKLFADMTSLNQAYIILPKDIQEAKNLLQQDE